MAESEPSISQVNRLGERLRDGICDEAELRLLDRYRRSFEQSYETVVQTIRNNLRCEPSGRPAKSTISIVDKLKREKSRLSKIQDIAGCRVIVDDLNQQDAAVDALKKLFPETSVVDRRAQPKHGYRAVHVIVEVNTKPIEIQIRTLIQHLWAELSEKCADIWDAEIKYGGGPEEVRQTLDESSVTVGSYEDMERDYQRLDYQFEKNRAFINDEAWKEFQDSKARHMKLKERIVDNMQSLSRRLKRINELNDALSN